jgi:hypothetical protein
MAPGGVILKTPPPKRKIAKKGTQVTKNGHLPGIITQKIGWLNWLDLSRMPSGSAVTKWEMRELLTYKGMWNSSPK